MNTQLDAEGLVHAFFFCLYVAWEELSPLIDLLDFGWKHFFGKRVHANFGSLANAHMPDLRFWDVDAHINLIAFKQSGDRRVGSDQIARADIEHLDRRSRGGQDLSLAVEIGRASCRERV